MQIKNLAITNGKCATIQGSVIKYMPTRPSSVADLEAPAERVFIKGDQFFSSGRVSFSFKYTSFSSGIFLILKAFDNSNIFCGYSRSRETFIIGNQKSGTMHVINSAGSLSNYDKNSSINMAVDVKGSSIKLYVNDILFCETDISIRESQIWFQLISDNDMELSNIEISKETQKIFVVMQFSEEYNSLYDEVIKPVVEEFGYECVRADDYYSSTPILTDIIESIQKSTAIIAEITPDNPNVFYEIGYSHAVGKPTILLCDRKRAKLPFDLSSFRTLFYENSISGKKKIEDNLKKYLENIA